MFPSIPTKNDLWSDLIDLGPGNQVIPVVALTGAETKTDPPTIDAADTAGVKAIREYRGGPEGSELF